MPTTGARTCHPPRPAPGGTRRNYPRSCGRIFPPRGGSDQIAPQSHMPRISPSQCDGPLCDPTCQGWPSKQATFSSIICNRGDVHSTPRRQIQECSPCQTSLSSYRTPGGTRTRNLWIRSPTPCPLGHGGNWCIFANANNINVTKICATSHPDDGERAARRGLTAPDRRQRLAPRPFDPITPLPRAIVGGAPAPAAAAPERPATTRAATQTSRGFAIDSGVPMMPGSRTSTDGHASTAELTRGGRARPPSPPPRARGPRGGAPPLCSGRARVRPKSL